MKYDRELPSYRDSKTRVEDYKEIYEEFGKDKVIKYLIMFSRQV